MFPVTAFCISCHDMTKQNGKFSQKTIQLGLDAFRKQDFENAYLVLSTQDHPVALNAAGVSAQRLSRFDDASNCFERASTLAPKDANVLNNWGHFELERGEILSARDKFQAALSFSPDLTAARIGLAKTLMAEEEWGQAKIAWSDILAATPNSRVAFYGLATCFLELGDTHQAIEGFEKLISAGRQPEIAFMLGRALLELGEFGKAEPELLFAHASTPSEYTLRTLASLYWMTDRVEKFDQLLSASPNELIAERIKLLLEADLVPDADATWRESSALLSQSSNGQVLRSLIAQKLDQIPLAQDAARKAISLDQGNDAAWEALIISELMSGNAQRVFEMVTPLRKSRPVAQNWIAYSADAERLLDRDLENPLACKSPWIQAHQIPVPNGYKTLSDFNAAFSEYLLAQHKLERRPLEQSLRGGTQTTRSLLADKSEIVRAYIEALDKPIQDYLFSIGTSNDHPTSARNRGEYSFSGMWSVRLLEQGYHESHIHPEGWISSAYYIKVPDFGADSKAGWIYFGKPPYQTSPSLEPLKWIKPEAGRLVLFPSFMWHGTVPIEGPVERITAPFDLMPG